MSKSYATFELGRSWRQLRHAWQERKRADSNMALLLRDLRTHEHRMEQKLGRRLAGLQMLEIGPGQGMERALYFSLQNDVTAVDLDVIPQGFSLGTYLGMLRHNGLGRFLKTVGRKLIIGRVNRNAWARVVGQDGMVPPRTLYGDICQWVPGASAFDVVMSWSVFEHLPDPAKALENVILSLRPGGIFYISLHLYTSNNGHHDIRAFTGSEDQLPLWGHLRPSTQHLIEPSSYLNQWRLGRWRELFAQLAPGAEEFLEVHDLRERYWAQLTPAIRQELAQFSDEELLTVDAIYLWQKPLK